MSASEGRPRRPTGLDGRGLRLWERLLNRFEFSVVEVELLVEVCRTAGAVEELEKQLRADGVVVEGARGGQRVHPALTELRHQRVAFGKLLAQLDLPDDVAVDSPKTARARKAAQARWRQERERREVG